jgi:hypothetical protein
VTSTLLKTSACFSLLDLTFQFYLSVLNLKLWFSNCCLLGPMLLGYTHFTRCQVVIELPHQIELPLVLSRRVLQKPDYKTTVTLEKKLPRSYQLQNLSKKRDLVLKFMQWKIQRSLQWDSVLMINHILSGCYGYCNSICTEVELSNGVHSITYTIRAMLTNFTFLYGGFLGTRINDVSFSEQSLPR